MDSGITSNPVIYGTGGYGRDGVTNWLDLAGLALVTGNGFGNNNRKDDYQQGLVDGTTAKYSDIVSAVANIDSNLNSGFDRIANVSRTGSELNLNAISGVKDSVQNSQFQTALQTKEIMSELCEIRHEIGNDGDKTRALINENTIQDLRDRNASLDLDSRGLHKASGPYASYHYPQASFDGQNEINIVNQNVNAIGSTVSQMATKMEHLAGVVAGLQK